MSEREVVITAADAALAAESCGNALLAARARIAEAERWARRVEHVARWADTASDEAHAWRKDSECDKPQYLEGRGDALDEAHTMLRKLVREMRGGGT